MPNQEIKQNEAIKISGLSKQYRDELAVDNLTLNIAHGELFALLGINGAGKTTTLKMLSCLIKPTSGDAFLSGYSIVSNPSSVKNIISLSPQETAIAPNLTVNENLALICGIYHFSKEKTKQQIKSFSQQFDLESVMNKKAGKLSGGVQRRLSIAMALINAPDILFLDEPTLGLDVIARKNLWQLIESLKGKMTIVLTTHYMEEAEFLSDRIGIMKDGKLLALGNLEELKNTSGENSLEDAFITIVKRGLK